MLTTITSRTRDLIDLPPDVLDLTLECGKLESFLLHAGVLRVETFQHFVQLDLEDRDSLEKLQTLVLRLVILAILTV